jgi:hypothetical protein
MILCPSGEQLYYQQPSRCGGQLDVDKNADNALTERPVENIFWPSGQAPLGTYQVAVKYYARKDQSVPPETEFRLQLLKAGQTTFFEGVVSPGELKHVTEFEVRR